MTAPSPLQLERPLVYFDIEATGVDPRRERIIDLFLLKVQPGGKEATRAYRFNPGVPIPPASTKVHGITDEMVKDRPPFRAKAGEILGFLQGCDLAGFGVLHYDLPLLAEELRRAGIEAETEGLRVVDAMTIFHRLNPRNLAAAYAQYCGKELEDAHQAEADIRATREVLEAMLERHRELPRDVEGLDGFCRPERDRYADPDGKFLWENDRIVFAFGKHRGRPLAEVAEKERGYLEWMCEGGKFPPGAVALIRRALKGELPER